jgi:hypothetical protein
MELKLRQLGKVDQKCLRSFEMWCWRRMVKISWTDRVRNEEVLQRVKEDRNIPQTVKRRKATWIGHILPRHFLLQHVIQGRLEVMGERGRRRKQLMDNFKECVWEAERGNARSHSVQLLLWKRHGPVVRLRNEEAHEKPRKLPLYGHLLCSVLKERPFGSLLGGSLSPRHGASSGCGWRNGLQLRRVAANTLNKQSRTADKGWSFSLGIGRGANNSSP